LTPAEYTHLRTGYYRRKRRQLEQAAQWVTILINHYPMRGKNAKTLRVEQLIGYSEEELAEIERKRKALREDMLRKKS